MTAGEVMSALIECCLTNLHELTGEDANQFCYGQKVALVKLLKVIQNWDRAGDNGLDFDVMKRYPCTFVAPGAPYWWQILKMEESETFNSYVMYSKEEDKDTTAEVVLGHIIKLLEFYLERLEGHEWNRFDLGAKYSYVECLEIAQRWDRFPEFGLTYEVEERFPL